MDTPSPDLQKRLNDLLLQGELDQKVLDLTRPVDLFILERMAYYRIEVKLMTSLGVSQLSADCHTNCLIEMYLELKKNGRIQWPPKTLPA